MRRREFIRLIGGAGLSWPLAARAQQPSVPVVGFLHSASPGPFARAVDAFRKGLSETGYIEGRNVVVEYRWAEGQYNRLPALAADLVRRQVSVIVAIATNGPAQAAKAATASIPIVFVTGGDPVSGGLVASLNRPAGNVTGVSWVATALVSKQLELLRGSTGNPALIGALVNPTHSDHDLQVRELQEAGAAIGKDINIVEAATTPEIEMAFASLVQRGADALIVPNDPFFISCRDQIVALAARSRIPAMYFTREFTEAGGLLSYGASLVDAARQGGVYAGKILHGVKPAELPVMQSVKFDPVKAGIVASLRRPGGNVTGVNYMAVELSAKRLSLLHELTPRAARIALLVNPANPVPAETITRDTEAAAATIGRHIDVYKAESSRESDCRQ